MGNFELVKLVSLYKAYCKGYLTPEIIMSEILDTRQEADNVFYKTGKEESKLNVYIKELEYLLFDIMHYKKED